MASDTICYTLSMRRGDRYAGYIDGVRHWKAKICGHPVPNNQTKRCRPCWFLSEDRKNALTKKRNYTVTRENHHSWKGGRVLHKASGYILIKDSTHPKAQKNGYVLEHRLVMEKHLGRYLETDEEIHHINHDKTDNRIENLMLFSNHSEHIAYEHKNGDRKK